MAFHDQNTCSSYCGCACGIRVKTVDSRTVQRYMNSRILAIICLNETLVFIYI
ncbi:MAG: hypothetical protein ACLUI0_12375 [Blautia massiliensis (ex Durand et al. 2017)]